eukprot:598381-Prorocentrum_minimum.AAC.2
MPPCISCRTEHRSDGQYHTGLRGEKLRRANYSILRQASSSLVFFFTHDPLPAAWCPRAARRPAPAGAPAGPLATWSGPCPRRARGGSRAGATLPGQIHRQRD